MVYSSSSQMGTMPNMYRATDSAEKIEVPVPSSLSVYAQFKYVRGVPASSSQEPVSLSRAQIIDNMVSFLNSSSNEHQLDTREEFSVQELEQEVHQFVNDNKPQFSSLPGKGIDTGIIFNITA